MFPVSRMYRLSDGSILKTISESSFANLSSKGEETKKVVTTITIVILLIVVVGVELEQCVSDKGLNKREVPRIRTLSRFWYKG